MGGFVVIAIAIVVAFTIGGVKMIAMGLRRRPQAPVPTARLANPDRAELVYTHTLRIGFILERVILVVAGVVTILAPWTITLLTIGR